MVLIYLNLLNCEDGVENRVYCNVCDNLVIERYYKNHLKSGTHVSKNHKRQRLDNTNMNI